MMTFARRTTLASLALLGIAVSGHRTAAQEASSSVVHAYGRTTVVVNTARAQAGGVLAVTVRGGRWATASVVFDGHRGALASDTGPLFGLIPVPLDTQPFEHRLSLYFPGGRKRGGATTVKVPIPEGRRPGIRRALTPEGVAQANSQAALGHARFLLRAIRTKDARAYQLRALQAPVAGAVSVPFGGLEDYGMPMGPMKDGLMGEHHRGIDYDVPVGTPVKAPGGGVVVLARSLLFSGETVVINHGRGLMSVLSHLSHVNVAEGDVVTQGAVVGASGKSGIGAQNPHLCFGVYLHSANIDPEAMLDPSLWGLR
jgi:hypothetical protein